MLSYTILRDSFLESELLTKYNLVNKSIHILCKVMHPDALKEINTKWFTIAELRKNTSILAGEAEIICSVGERVGLLRSKFEYGKGKYQFDVNILQRSEAELKDALRLIETTGLSERAVKALQQRDYAAQNPHSRNRRKGVSNRLTPADIKSVPDEVITKELWDDINSKKYRKSLIDDPETVAIYHTQKAMDAGTLNQETALDLHNQGKCGNDPLKCRCCALAQGKITELDF